jgi:hemerythrin-like domain-containing protein
MVPLMDLSCVHCANVAVHYRILYSEHASRMEELSILRHSQAEHESLVRELHALRNLFEQQRVVLESGVRVKEPNAGLFSYLEVIATEQRQRTVQQHAAFDEKMKRVKEGHAYEMAVLRAEYEAALKREQELRAVPPPVEQVESPEPSPDAVKAAERLISLEAEMQEARRHTREQQAMLDHCVESLNCDNDRLRTDNERLLAENERLASTTTDMKETAERLRRDEAELTKRLREASHHIMELQRKHHDEQQDLLKKRDALQVKLFDSLQSVSALQRRFDDVEAKLEQQQIYVRIAHDVQALMMDIPESVPQLVHPKSPAAMASESGTGAASKRKNKKKH